MVEAVTQPAEPSRAGAGGELGLEQQLRMLRSLRRGLAERLGQPVAQHETHISFVLVCGDHAYKFKKALKTAFLDQSTLALRQRACDEELRLNRRLAPDLYLGVVPITGRPGNAALAGAGAIIDVAVKMRAFAQRGLWDARAARRQLRATHIDELAQVLVPFHAAATVADAHGKLGAPAQVRAPLLQSLDELGASSPRLRSATTSAGCARGRRPPASACSQCSPSGWRRAGCANATATCTWATSRRWPAAPPSSTASSSTTTSAGST